MQIHLRDPASAAAVEIRVRDDQAHARLLPSPHYDYEYHDNAAPFGHKRVAWLYMSHPPIYARDCEALGIPPPAAPYFIAGSHLQLDPDGFSFLLHTRETVNTPAGGYRLERRAKRIRFVRI